MEKPTDTPAVLRCRQARTRTTLVTGVVVTSSTSETQPEVRSRTPVVDLRDDASVEQEIGSENYIG